MGKPISKMTRVELKTAENWARKKWLDAKTAHAREKYARLERKYRVAVERRSARKQRKRHQAAFFALPDPKKHMEPKESTWV